MRHDMQKLFIGYDFENNPTGVLVAETRQQAELVWMGMKEGPHHVEEIDLSKPIGLNGVGILFTSHTVRAAEFGRNPKEFRVFKRGL